MGNIVNYPRRSPPVIPEQWTLICWKCRKEYIVSEVVFWDQAYRAMGARIAESNEMCKECKGKPRVVNLLDAEQS